MTYPMSVLDLSIYWTNYVQTSQTQYLAKICVIYFGHGIYRGIAH